MTSTTRASGLGVAAVTLLAVCVSFPQAQADDQEAEQITAGKPDVTNAVLRTATIYVKNWDASLRFYSQHLGYSILVERTIDAEKSLRTIGARPGEKARIVYLKPNNSEIERPFAGNYLGLIEISGAERDESQYQRAEDLSVGIKGEVVLAHQVVGIDRIYEAMQEDDSVHVVATLSLSGAGQSRSFSVIDPNGVRVEIYEYLAGNEPKENP